MAELLRVDRCPTGLSLAGEIDAHTATLLDEAIAEYFAVHRGSNSPTIRLSMAGVTFMDSIGLRVVLQATETARSMGGDLVLLDPTAPVRRVVDVTGLDDHLTLEPRSPGEPPGAPS